jgi:hypothetical protein
MEKSREERANQTLPSQIRELSVSSSAISAPSAVRVRILRASVSPW